MSPERWHRVERLYTEALNLPVPDRAAFLAAACDTDTGLYKEVESLLAEADRCSVFLSSPSFESALQSIVDPRPVAVPRKPARRQPAFFWLAIAAGAAMLVFYACAGWVLFRDVSGEDFGWEYRYSRDGWIVTRTYPDGPAAGTLQPGDRIIGINGDTRASRIGPEAFRQFLGPGASYSVQVQRSAQERAYKLQVLPWHDPGGLSRALSYGLLSVATFAAGLALALLKPTDRVAQLGCGAAFLSVMRSLATPISFSAGTAPDAAWMLNQLASFSFPGALAVAYHFFSQFAASSATEWIWRALRNAMYAVTAVVLISQLTFFAASLCGLDTLVDLAARHLWLAEGHIIFVQTFWSGSQVFALAAICIVSISGYRRSADVTQRRRVRWFAFGSALGLAPMLLLNLVGVLLITAGRRTLMETATWYRLRWVTDSFQIAMPFSLAFAVLKHGLLDIRVVIRRGFRYLLARQILTVFLLFPVAGLLIPILRNPNRTISELFLQRSSALNLVLLALIGVSLRYRSELRNWLDRRFFREAYRQEEILHRLIARIKNVESIKEVARLVCNELDSALHPDWLYVCQWKGELRNLAIMRASRNGAIETTAVVPADVARLLHACRTPVECPVPRDDTRTSQSDSLLVIPVAASSAPVRGAILLGAKKSEEPYTDTDRRLLEGAAGTVAVALENLWLKKRVDDGTRERREVLGRLDREIIRLLKECPECGACFDSGEESCLLDGNELIFSLPVERTIERRYRLDHRIGKGGKGVVYEATDVNLARKVAVKVMLGSLFGDSTAVRRFAREAQVLTRLNHRHIVTIHDFGHLGGDGAFLVMERLSGYSWRSELQRLGQLPPDRAAMWLDQLLDGLDAAHQAGVVHRDLKPESVIIDSRDGIDRLKILDFGLAKVRSPGAIEPSVTEAGVVLGTLSYMAPEQLKGDQAVEASDIFSVALMVVEALTGRLPKRGAFDGYISIASIQIALAERFAVCAGLQKILLRCLDSNPASRCSAAGMRDKLPMALGELR